MNQYSLQTLASWLGICHSSATLIRSFQHDSRQVAANDVFFALKGERSDGHAHLKEVAARGACAAVVSKEYVGEDFGMVLFPVDDVLVTLQVIAKAAMEKRSCKVIGVTGSVGKTTTKEFIADLLSSRFRTARTPGNMNSQIGLPLFILNQLADEEICVVEMSMSEPGNLLRLIDMIPPDVAVITKIALAHAAYFPEGLSAIARAKGEILQHPCTQVGFINVQAAEFDGVAQSGNCPKVIYGWDGGGYRLVKQGEKFQIIENGESTVWFSLPFAATHLCENFLGAATVARYYGLSWEMIFERAAKLKVYEKRFETIERLGITFINDSYNANPTSMKAALMNLPKPLSHRRVIAVIGEMRELGRFEESGHREVGEVALHHVDHALCFGNATWVIAQMFCQADKPGEHFTCLEELKKRVFALAEPGDVVLLKGSNSMQLWKILD